ncbi:MAG: hypothetical protein AB1465_04195 [Patescibacteria group bacterium]
MTSGFLAGLFGREFWKIQPLDFSWWHSLPGIVQILIVVVIVFLGAMTVFSQFTLVYHFGQLLKMISGLWLGCWHNLFYGKGSEQSLAGRIFNRKSEKIENSSENNNRDSPPESSSGYNRGKREPTFLRLFLVSIFFLAAVLLAAYVQRGNIYLGIEGIIEVQNINKNIEIKSADDIRLIGLIIFLLILEAFSFHYFFSKLEEKKVGIVKVLIPFIFIIIIVMIEFLGLISRAQRETGWLPELIKGSTLISYVYYLLSCLGAPIFMGYCFHRLMITTSKWWRKRVDYFNNRSTNAARKGAKILGKGTMEIGISFKTGVIWLVKAVFFLIVAVLFFAATLMLLAFGLGILRSYILWIIAYCLVLAFFLLPRLLCERIFRRPSIPRVLMNTDKRVWQDKAIWHYPTILIEEVENYLEYLNHKKDNKEGDDKKI